MADKQRIALRFSEEIYATRQDVIRELRTSMVDTFWNDISILPVLKGVFIFLTIVACGLYTLSIYRYRMLFGLVVFACFSVFGSILYLYNRSLIVYDWSDEEQIYIGRLTENPVPKKKTMKAVVEVTQVKTGDTLPEWKAVNRKIILYWMPDTTQQPLTYGDEICFRAQISRPVSDAHRKGAGACHGPAFL